MWNDERALSGPTYLILLRKSRTMRLNDPCSVVTKQGNCGTGVLCESALSQTQVPEGHCETETEFSTFHSAV